MAQQRGLLSAKEAALLDEKRGISCCCDRGFDQRRDHGAVGTRRRPGCGQHDGAQAARNAGHRVCRRGGHDVYDPVPLTVAASQVLMLEEQDHTFAPLPAIARIALPRQELATLGSQTVFYIDGQPHTVLRLSEADWTDAHGEAPARQPCCSCVEVAAW